VRITEACAASCTQCASNQCAEKDFRELVERYASKVYQVSFGILGNRDDADEVAQEVFAKVHSSIYCVGGRSSLHSWILRTTVNECYGFFRKKQVNLPLIPDRAGFQRDYINELLAQIPEDDRWMLVSKEVEGFSLGELSQMTGLNESRIKRRLFRTRQSLVAAAARAERKFSAARGI
jgi:RNA polymerase sigma-70 factor (ECF subfamily)